MLGRCKGLAILEILAILAGLRERPLVVRSVEHWGADV